LYGLLLKKEGIEKKVNGYTSKIMRYYTVEKALRVSVTTIGWALKS